MTSLPEYLKKHSLISSKFIDDFFSLYDHKTLDTDFVINLDILASWLNAIKGSLKETLMKSYTENVDYKVTKIKNNKKGRPFETIMLTPDCMKRLCMLSRSPKAEEVRTYYIELEKHIDKYKNVIFEKYEINQKPIQQSENEGVVYVLQSDLNLSGVYKIGKTIDFKSRMKSHHSSHNDNVIVKLIYKTEFMDEVEKCLKYYMREKQYRKYKEFFEVDIDIIKKMIKECDRMSLIARKTINGKNHKGGYFLYIDKNKKK
jgi:phage anti-repressor protein/predicted GIY-YIG superfamily endonuclease